MSGKSPLFSAEGPVECVIQSGGKSLSSVLPIVSVDVDYRINMIPKAVVVIEDGEMSDGTFSLSDGNELVPGAEIIIKAGYGTDSTPIFNGIVVRHAVSISKNGFHCVKIECRDKAIAMTCARKNANFLEKSDDDIVKSLTGKYGVSIKSQMGGEAHKEILQYYCTDWDFMMTRVEANGCWLLADSESMSIEKISDKGDSGVELTWGTDIIEFKAEANAQFMVKNVEAKSWDATKQNVISSKSSAKSLGKQDDLNGSELAKVLNVSTNTLQTNSTISKRMLTSWAEAEQLKNELSRICGSVTCVGSVKVKLGKLVNLKNVGTHFKGGALVSGIHHHVGDGFWSTEYTFGMPKEWFFEKFETSAPIASGLNCGVHGLMTGVVMQIHEDPEKLNRVKVNIPLMENEKQDVWARLGGAYASKGNGLLFFPEVGDEVVLGFFGGDPSCPVILGSLYSGMRNTPKALEQKNNVKMILTREKLSVEFNEEKKSVTISTPGNRTFVLDDDAKKILVSDDAGNKLEMSNSGIKIESNKDIAFKTKGKFNVTATGGINLTSNNDLKGEGLNVEWKAKIGLTAKGTAKAELSASGQTVVKGAMVQIN